MERACAMSRCRAGRRGVLASPGTGPCGRPMCRGRRGQEGRRGGWVAGRASQAEVEEAAAGELQALREERLKRSGKYVAKVAGTEVPEWTRARVVAARDVLAGLREITLDVETSRELVSLRNSYDAVGKLAQIKVRGSEPAELVPSSSPFPAGAQHEPLLKLRGDLRAGQTKLPEDPISVRARLSLLVSKGDGEAFNLQVEGEEVPEDEWEVELGPFLGTGMDLQGKVKNIFAYPILLLFAEGAEGIATAKALIESKRASLDLKFRDVVKLYYKVANDDSVCFQELFDSWKKDHGVQVVTHTSTFLDAFEDDDDLVYEPHLTAAISFGGKDAEKEVREVCEEGEIPLHIPSSKAAAEMKYSDTRMQV